MSRAALLAAFLGFFVLWGRADAADPPAQQGRFQVFFSPHVRADTFLVDTQTGEVWILTKFQDLNGEPVAWDAMTRLDTIAQYQGFVGTFGKKATAPKPTATKPPSTRASP